MVGGYPDSMVSTPVPETDKPCNPHRPRRRSVVVALVGICGGLIFGVPPLLDLLPLPIWLLLPLIFIAGLTPFEVFGRVMGRRYPDDPRFGRFVKDWPDAARLVAHIGILWGLLLAGNHIPLPIWLLLPLIFIAGLTAFEVFFRIMGRRYPDDPRFACSIVLLFYRVVGRRYRDGPRIGSQRRD